MLVKQCQWFGSSESGVFCQPLFGSYGVFEKVAGAPAFADWATGDRIRAFIEKITARDRQENAYVLLNALGAGEFFGSNINADYFPWSALSHEGKDYGYQTFLDSHAFQHHVNKDPNRAFGRPVLSLLNDQMKRVELITSLNREKAKAEGAASLVTRIDNGEFPDVSMGCKVPYDVCSICGNKSRTPTDYCKHMRPPEELRGIYGPNKIIEGGKKIYVINTLPRFFDISFVFIGADKTAKVMAKLASKGQRVCLGDVCAVPRSSVEVAELVDPEVVAVEGQEKTASAPEEECCIDCGDSKLGTAFGVKTADEKVSEIVKEIPASQFAMHRLMPLANSEPDIPKDKIQLLASHPLGTAAGTLGSLGIVLKPHEFQAIILIKMGEKTLAEKLAAKNQVFRTMQTAEFPGELEFDSKLAHAMVDLIPERTAFGNAFMRRSAGLMKQASRTQPSPTPIQDPVLDEISVAYNGYRQALLTKMAKAEEVIENDPVLGNAVYGRSLQDAFLKTASAPLVSLESIAYLAGAHIPANLLGKEAVAAEVAADPWMKRHLSAQGF